MLYEAKYLHSQEGDAHIMLTEKCVGFPKACRGRDEGQFAVQSLVEPHEQTGAADNVRPKWREIQFRG
jgi:hypothetical protein